MDRRGEASHRGRSSYRGRGWRGRGRGGGRPSPSPPSSTASPAALNPVPSLTPAVPDDDAAPIMGTCPDMCPGTPSAHMGASLCSAKAMKPAGSRGLVLPWRQRAPPVRPNCASCSSVGSIVALSVLGLMAAVFSVAARERAQRERLRDLAVLERVDGDPARTSLSLAVKKVSHLFAHAYTLFLLALRLFMLMCKVNSFLLVLLPVYA